MDYTGWSDAKLFDYVWSRKDAGQSTPMQDLLGALEKVSDTWRDHYLVHYLREVRKHAGLMPPGPVQAAAVVALADDVHVDEQRERYLRRLTRLRDVFTSLGYPCDMPAGAFYLWDEIQQLGAHPSSSPKIPAAGQRSSP